MRIPYYLKNWKIFKVHLMNEWKKFKWRFYKKSTKERLLKGMNDDHERKGEKFILYYPEICKEEIYDTAEELVEKLGERIEDGSYKKMGYVDIQHFNMEDGKWTKK